MAPLQQINLKVPDRVAAHWRAQAQAAGLSVRDWLVALTVPTDAPQAAPGGRLALADRVAQLEALTADLAQTVAQLQTEPCRLQSEGEASPTPSTGYQPPAHRVPDQPQALPGLFS